jgi:putative hydrolase of HD superfamily
MKHIADLLFEAKMLKEIPRSGYHFLGAGNESIAEHTFNTTFIAYVMSQLDSGIDALKLITMCLLHDLPEARIGDLNTVQKTYVTADEAKALKDTTRHIPFGSSITGLLKEFSQRPPA